MKNPGHRVIVFGLLAILATGCTLAGANAAPLTPVSAEPGGVVLSPQAGAPEAEETLPTPTTTGPIDVFGTQTAMAPPVVETEEPMPGTGATAEPGGVIVAPPTESAAPTAEATPEVPPTPLPEPTQAPAAGTCPPTHTVQAGENLYRIALRYGLTYQELAAANGITNPDAIQAGTVLTIPGCGEAQPSGGEAPATGGEVLHTVQPGENLFRISLRYGVSWEEIARYNGITNPNAISVGQVIRIPTNQ